jgi:hypothetical protein
VRLIVALSQFFTDIRGTLIDVFAVLSEGGTTIASNGKVDSIPYINEVSLGHHTVLPKRSLILQ